MEQLVPALLERGWPGIIIAGLGFALWKAWGVIEKKQERIDDLQEKRMTEALRNIQVVEQNNTAIAGLITLIQDRGQRQPRSEGA